MRGGPLLDPRTAGVCPECAQDHVSEVALSRCPAAAGRAGSFRARPTAGRYQPGSTSRSCLSTWLNGGIYPKQEAERAGDSGDVRRTIKLLRLPPSRQS